MYELVPPGFSEVHPACLRIAKAHWPESFQATDAPDDPSFYADMLYLVCYEPHTLGETLDPRSHNEISAFGKAHKSVRKALSDSQITAYALDGNARANPIWPPRHWATDDGNAELLTGLFFDALSLKDRRILLRDEVVQTFVDLASRPENLPTKGKSGRKPKLNPENVRHTVFELMDLNGDFVPEDREWNAQARLEEAVRQRFVAALEMSESALRSAIAPHLASWRKSKA